MAMPPIGPSINAPSLPRPGPPKPDPTQLERVKNEPSTKGDPSRQARSNLSDESSQQAHQAEREANLRITSAANRAAQAERDASRSIDEVSDRFDRQVQTETERKEAQIEAIRAKGYERVREAQRAQAAEISRVQREGDKQIRDIGDYYRSTTYSKARTGNREVQQIQSEHSRRMEYELQRGKEEIGQLEQDRQDRLSAATLATRSEREQLEAKQDQHIDELKQRYSDDTIKNRQHFESRFKNQLDAQDSVLDHLNLRAGSQIEEIRSENSLKLSAYEKRQQDPFYKLIDLHASLTDHGDSYTLAVELPSHETNHVNATIQGESIIVTGRRSNQEQLTDPDGSGDLRRTKATATYQTFRESFPLDWPVDAKKLSRHVEDGVTIFKVPKKGPYAKRETPIVQSQPEKLRQSRPKFPPNLESMMPAAEVHDPRSIHSRKPGSGTLS